MQQHSENKVQQQSAPAVVSDFALSIYREKMNLIVQLPQLINGLSFFLVLGFILHLMVGTQVQMEQIVILSFIWTQAVVALLLIADGWFRHDVMSQFYDFWLSEGRSLLIFLWAKVFLQWLVCGGALSLMVPILALLLGLDGRYVFWLMGSMMISSLGLVSLAAFGAAVTANLSQGGLLLALLVIPLAIPCLVFGIGGMIALLQNYNPWPVVMISLALSIAYYTFLMPFAGLVLKFLNE